MSIFTLARLRRRGESDLSPFPAGTRSPALPVILFLHGAGESGSDGLAQTTVGLGVDRSGRLGGYVVAAWLTLIAVSLIASDGFSTPPFATW